ncbi:hypothetical protein FAIPA1_10449 [Frankia sp. AiPs1]
MRSTARCSPDGDVHHFPAPSFPISGTTGAGGLANAGALSVPGLGDSGGSPLIIFGAPLLAYQDPGPYRDLPSVTLVASPVRSSPTPMNCPPNRCSGRPSGERRRP